MDSAAPQGAQPTILVFETNANRRELIACTLGQAGYDAVLPPSRSDEAALDFITPANFDGRYCEIQFPGKVDSREVAPIFSSAWPDKPTVYASALVLGHRATEKGILLHKPCGLDRLVRVFETSATAARARQALT